MEGGGKIVGAAAVHGPWTYVLRTQAGRSAGPVSPAPPSGSEAQTVRFSKCQTSDDTGVGK
ncbi:hypothetical protein CGRA01v4_07080 [Colletotrichum graminicola]|nr:hypothetical protein CGRA01v4_07080 [Colletotrichum graminicola]